MKTEKNSEQPDSVETRGSAQRPVRLTLGLAHNPRASTDEVSRIDAIAWLSGHAIRSIPEAARLEEEIRRLQRLCIDSGVSKADVFLAA